jgi:hypothetical protein
LGDVVSLAKSVQGCQDPECFNSRVSFGEAVAVWLSGLNPRKFLHWVYLLRVNDGKAKSGVLCPESRACRRVVDVSVFQQYRQALAGKVVVVRHRSDNSRAKVIRQSDSSRYFPEGRYRIKARIVKRMGGFFSCNGLLLSATYDPKLLTLDEAWSDVGDRSRRFLDNLNRWRCRNGMPRVRGIRVVEAQPCTGYPHIHIAFPKLRWLAPISRLTEWWGQAVNSVDLMYRDGFSPAGYVCKYVSKLEGWSDEAMAQIWFNHTRIYSMARDYYVQPLDKRVPEWSFYSSKADSLFSMAELMVSFDDVECRDKSLLYSGFT